MHIVFAASECLPFAKRGGLADVIGALPPELVKLGHRIDVYVPLYKSVRKALPEDLTYAVRSITVPFTDYNRFAGIVKGGVVDGVQYYFVDCPELFDRDGIYGTVGGGEFPDNAERFAFFSRAVLEATKLLGVPEVFHVHDWPTAFIPIYLRSLYYYDPMLRKAASVLTIHNAGYQGWFPPKTTAQLLLPWDMYTPEKLEQNGNFNTLKGGVVFADYLTTVSKTYALEIQTEEYGSGLDAVLRTRHWDLRGIQNGVDYREWDPAKDSKLAAHYTAGDLTGKTECRKDLLHAFGFEGIAETTPVVGIVARFVTQKGFDLLIQVADQLLERNLVLVAMGTGEAYYENFFRELAAKRPKQVAAQIKYESGLAHKVEAGSDMFLMPSRYEPSGLNQIYSMKYGTVP